MTQINFVITQLADQEVLLTLGERPEIVGEIVRGQGHNIFKAIQTFTGLLTQNPTRVLIDKDCPSILGDTGALTYLKKNRKDDLQKPIIDIDGHCASCLLTGCKSGLRRIII